jgi:hypothetical protein
VEIPTSPFLFFKKHNIYKSQGVIILKMVWYQEVIYRLRDIGLLDVILPFLLVFAVVFALLQKVHILGDVDTKPEVKRYNLIVALVIGLLVVVPHVLYGGASGDGELTLTTRGGQHYPDVVDIMNNSLPSIALWIIAILAVMLLIGMAGGNLPEIESYKNWIFWGSIVIVFVVFGIAANWFTTPSWLGFLNDRVNQAIVFVVVGFGVLVWYMTKAGTTNGGGGGRTPPPYP